MTINELIARLEEIENKTQILMDGNYDMLTDVVETQYGVVIR